MITRGIVEEVIDKFKYRVRIPIFDRVEQSSHHTSFSDLSVATVNNGLTEATGVGSANITASVGEFSAICVVTVEDTGALPVLNVSDESLELIVGGNYSIDANVTYKRNLIESATITYEILDASVASVDENGNVTADMKLAFGKIGEVMHYTGENEYVQIELGY